MSHMESGRGGAFGSRHGRKVRQGKSQGNGYEVLVSIYLLLYQGIADSRWIDMVVEVAVAMTADID